MTLNFYLLRLSWVVSGPFFASTSLPRSHLSLKFSQVRKVDTPIFLQLFLQPNVCETDCSRICYFMVANLFTCYNAPFFSKKLPIVCWRRGNGLTCMYARNNNNVWPMCGYFVISFLRTTQTTFSSSSRIIGNFLLLPRAEWAGFVTFHVAVWPYCLLYCRLWQTQYLFLGSKVRDRHSQGVRELTVELTLRLVIGDI